MEPDPADRVHHLIYTRHSARAPFDPSWHVSPRELAYLVEAARWAPTPHNMQNFELVVVEDTAVIGELGAICAPVSPLFIAENARQLSASPEELARRQTGLLATSLPPEFRSDVPPPEGATRKLDELIAGAPMLIFVIYDPTTHAPASAHDELGLIGLGCILENIWLVAQTLKLDLQVVSSFAADAVMPQVERVLEIPPPWRIAYAVRIGHAIAPATVPRVRRDAPRFVHRNHFTR